MNQPPTYDFLLIGQGLAGSVLAAMLLQHGYNVGVIDKDSGKNCSRVAAGLYNPVTGGRWAISWKAPELFEYLPVFYDKLEKQLGCKLLYPQHIYRPFSNIEDKNFGLARIEQEKGLNRFLTLTDELDNLSQSVRQDFGGVLTSEGGWLDIPTLLDKLRQLLKTENRLIEADFDHQNLIIHHQSVEWNGISAKNIVFCEGVGLSTNPLFGYARLAPLKGEILDLEIPNFRPGCILNKGKFLLELPQGGFRAGSSYEHHFEGNGLEPNPQNTLKIGAALDSFLQIPYHIIGQKAGIRPAINDRRPVIGPHYRHKNVFIFNGMGTKAVSLAPVMARQLVGFLGVNPDAISDAIWPENDIRRFEKHIPKQG